ncbi:MAG: hypothetical protein MHMPM18_000842 [Marteilia pararefringens]
MTVLTTTNLLRVPAASKIRLINICANRLLSQNNSSIDGHQKAPGEVQKLQQPELADRSGPKESRFSALADCTLEAIHDGFDSNCEPLLDNYDSCFSNSTLEINVGSSCVYVLNKHSMSQQIWISSPLSGPSRYSFDTKNMWIESKSKKRLITLIEEEISQLCRGKISNTGWSKILLDNLSRIQNE